jgi:hypothetical protein
MLLAGATQPGTKKKSLRGLSLPTLQGFPGSGQIFVNAGSDYGKM